MLRTYWDRSIYGKLLSGVTKRQIKIFCWSVVLMMFAGSAAAVAADGATTPTGFGDLIPLPDLTNGGDKTLLESFAWDTWQLDSELDFKDPVQNTFYGLCQLLFMLLKILVYMCVGLTYWLFSLVKIDGISGSIAGMIGSASAELMTWLFPASLAFGAVMAYALRQRDGQGGNWGQISWLVASAILGISLASGSSYWVQGVDNSRTIGAEVVTGFVSESIDPNNTTPIEWQEVTYNGTPSENLLRKSGDSLWRSVLVTPWCIANYGSIEACQKYGIDMLNRGSDLEERKQYIKDVVYDAEGGKDAPTSQWVKGERWADRLGVLAMSIILAVILCGLLLVLGFAALIATVMAYMLLLVGVPFAMMWVIPGMPRQWGIAWFQALIGAILTSVMAMIVFAVTLILTTLVLSTTAEFGWAPNFVLAIIVALTAFKLRNHLDRIFNAFQPGLGRAAITGALAMRGGRRAVSGAVGGARQAARLFSRDKPSAARAGSSGGGGGGQQGPGRGGSGSGTGPKGGNTSDRLSPRQRNFRQGPKNQPVSDVAPEMPGSRRPAGQPASPTGPGRSKPRKNAPAHVGSAQQQSPKSTEQSQPEQSRAARRSNGSSAQSRHLRTARPAPEGTSFSSARGISSAELREGPRPPAKTAVRTQRQVTPTPTTNRPVPVKAAQQQQQTVRKPRRQYRTVPAQQAPQRTVKRADATATRTR